LQRVQLYCAPMSHSPGSLLLSVSGRQAVGRANALADSLAQTFSTMKEVRVGRPMRKGEVRLRGLMSFFSQEEILLAVVSVGGCRLEDLRAGPIRLPSGSSVGTMWLRCPDHVARGLARAGELRVGWVALSVIPLGRRPLQCFHCLAFGHASARCGSATDRSNIALIKGSLRTIEQAQRFMLARSFLLGRTRAIVRTSPSRGVRRRVDRMEGRLPEVRR